MSKHATEAMLDNIQQKLIENMADFLDDESTKLDEAIALIKDPVPTEESELHIRMANAAFNEYKNTMLASQLHPSPTPDVTEAVFTKDDMGSAVEFGYRQYKKYGYISPKEEEDFINSKTKNNEQQ